MHASLSTDAGHLSFKPYIYQLHHRHYEKWINRGTLWFHRLSERCVEKNGLDSSLADDWFLCEAHNVFDIINKVKRNEVLTVVFPGK